jgi:hypothetical protein
MSKYSLCENVGMEKAHSVVMKGGMARESDGLHYTVTGFSSAAALVDIDSSHFFLSTRRGVLIVKYRK